MNMQTAREGPHAGIYARRGAVVPLSRRARLEAALERLADLRDEMIAKLDTLDGDPDLEDGGDAEPSIYSAPLMLRDGTVIDDAEGDGDCDAEDDGTKEPEGCDRTLDVIAAQARIALNPPESGGPMWLRDARAAGGFGGPYRGPVLGPRVVALRP